MKAYTIIEKSDLNATREGTKIFAKSLAAAKQVATKTQFFHGTVLEIQDENGNRLATKTSTGTKWFTYE